MNDTNNSPANAPVDVLAKIDAAIKVAEFTGTDYPAPVRKAEGLRAARDRIADLFAAIDSIYSVTISEKGDEKGRYVSGIELRRLFAAKVACDTDPDSLARIGG